MRIPIVAYHAPREEGSAAGRQLFAVGTALRALGHEPSVLCWQVQEPPDLPDWATWQPLPSRPAWQVRARAVLRPRGDSSRLRSLVPDGPCAVADDPFSFAAVAHTPRPVTGVHYAVDLDRRAQRDRSPQRVQDRRAERTAVGRSAAVWTFSDRVRTAVGRGVVVPATLPLPAQPVALVDEPVVGLLADWSWAPNVTAARSLVAAWPAVRDRVPGARLVLAGRGSSPVGPLAGVDWLGEVPQAADLLARLAVFAFPCPDTSGPKMKTLDALAHGVPVVTTAAGAEGVHPDAGILTGDLVDGIVDGIVALLSDPQRRAALAAQGRQAMATHHAPEVAARARVDVLRATAGP